jgi:phosphate butyryltransferase
MFRNLDELVMAARQRGPARIAVAAGHDPDVLAALKQARDMGLADGILVGNTQKIRALADPIDYRLAPEQIIHEMDEATAARKAIALVREGRADLLMKGKLPTATLVRAVLDREAGLRTGRQLSQVIVFQVPGIKRLMIMSDAAINIAPTIEQKAEICRNAIEVAHAIGIEKPNLAALCALEFVNQEMPATVDAAALCLKAGNAVLLRGGKEASDTNAVLGGLIRGALLESGLPEDAVGIVPATDREGIKELITLTGLVDLVIPRVVLSRVVS